MTRCLWEENKLADTRWMAQAACVGHTALPWIRDLSREHKLLVDIMRDLCEACPVRKRCAAYVVEAEITAGWWAGRSLNGFTHWNPPTAEDMGGDMWGDAA
jgi:hypothetical protein